MPKVINLTEAISRIKDGDTVALGGNLLHRTPIGAVTEMAVQQKKKIHLVKTAGAHDIDLLCATGCVSSVTFGYLSYEPPFGMCHFFRKAVENGTVKANENACYTVIMALRAAVYGLSFIPTAGLSGSDLVKANRFKNVADPYTGKLYPALPAIRPDFTIIHVQKADAHGNCKIIGPKYEDEIKVRAAKKVLVTAEELVDTALFKNDPSYADIPWNLVDGVIHLPKGAFPGSCAGYYGVNDQMMKRFKQIRSPKEILLYVERLRKTLNLSSKKVINR